jgi:glutathione S-transferase
MSFTLYNYVLSGNCYKVRLLASLLDLSYDSVSINFYPGEEHKSLDMLALNPAGTIPVLKADDLILTESQAMLAWLAKSFDASGQWWPTEDIMTMTGIMQWLAFSSRLSSTVGEARLHTMLKLETDLPVALASATIALRELEAHLFERSLDHKTWLVGDRPTIADIACFPYVALSPDAGIEHDAYPSIRAWLYAIKSLDGFVAMPGIFELHEQRENHAETQVTE